MKKQSYDIELQNEPKVKPYITVGELYENTHEWVQLAIFNNKASFNRKIKEKELHRPGLALAGFVEVFTYWRIQLLGNSEIGFLNTLHGRKRIHAIATVLGFDLPCIVITNNNRPPAELVEIADHNGISIFTTPLTTTTVTHYLGEYLDAVFAPQIVVHGSLVDVYSVGLLITGRAAIGKSELTLDLVERGHQLVADDVVNITKTGTNRIQGAPSEIIEHHMEIRGLGIIDIRRMFGIRAIRGKKDIHVVVKLEHWEAQREYERIGVDEKNIELLGVPLPLVELPIFTGKNITVIAEVIAMNHKLKQHGVNPAKEFNDRLINIMQDKIKNKEAL
ncbi:HPr(Ser) kinase/phosphatase [candidate division KSB1 bacterium]|nr:HPr(Ser) kinase/phosphatase [candidate division KSB1 bacterium]